MTHTLITYIFNIASIFIKMAKTPQVIRKFKVSNIVDHKEVKMVILMHSTLMDQLQLCSVTSSTQNIFAQAPVSFKIFYPSLYTLSEPLTCTLPKMQYKELTQTETYNKKSKGEPRGAIINTIGKTILPRGLDKKYCANLLDSASICSHGNSCKFVHALYPKGFTNNDRSIIDKHSDTPRLSLHHSIKTQRVSS